MNPPTVKFISESFIKPKYSSEESKKPVYLAPWDLMMLSVHYIQKGLLFPKPPGFNDDENSFKDLLQKLKDSLSVTLVHFFPLAGRLATLQQDEPPLYTIYIKCANSPGARFIQASLNLSVSDILSPTDVPPVVQSFFDHDRAINHDGHTESLLTIQVTELIDGIFIGCSINHVVADGSSFWHFFNAWSEVFKAKGENNLTISRPPIHKHWFPEGHDPILNLPFTHHDQFTSRHDSPLMRERVFHFSAASLAKIKAKANSECNTTKISTLQALSAHIWRCVTRARGFLPDQNTSCRLAINNRTRLNPPLPDDYFGNCIQTVKATTTAGKLLRNGLGWAAWQLHQTVINHTDKLVLEWVDSWQQTHFIYQLGQFFDTSSIMMGSSPRFDMYGNEFGLGKALAIRSGYANKFDGKVSLYPGIEGGVSMDLEICLQPHFMTALESDQEFTDTV
ncbi:HXXXD-type acyl-transferase family protein [Forsythia ovata]|uniref:HXXXD-type acyl-transferase family protein n=1 Tax=Forsythia ovata TaxID=205694 RepID=A0ABD1USA2_9LAMI